MMLAVGLLLLLAQLWPCILSISPLQNVICVFEDNSKQNQLDLSYRHNCTSFPNNLSVAAQEVIDGTVLLFLNKEETIESLIEFINVSGLTLLGTNDTNIVCNQTTVKHGLEFINVTDLKISGLSIINCGCCIITKQTKLSKILRVTMLQQPSTLKTALTLTSDILPSGKVTELVLHCMTVMVT